MNMKTIKFYLILFAVSMSLQSCLDFDDPGDEFSQTQDTSDDTIYHGLADAIDYNKYISQQGLTDALKTLRQTFAQCKGGQYAMRGGKQAQMPVAHAYQRQFTLGPDNYAQFAVVPHTSFMYGTLNSTYAVSPEFNPGPYSCYNENIKNSFTTLLNRPEIDSIPEMKAIYLLLFDYSSQEAADLYGPFPYVDYKNNKQESPFTYNDLRTIYVNMEANVDTIVKCLKHYESRPDWYKSKVQNQMYSNLDIAKDREKGKAGMETWIRFANSFKLRLAIHISKVDPDLAKKWAEDAVAQGVIENTDNEIELSPMVLGFSHPLIEIYKSWGDERLSASFESLLMSLGHPYTEYLFEKNNNAITNKNTKEVLASNTKVVGIRSGTRTGEGQSASSNEYIGFSSIQTKVMALAPLYIMKMSEVDFLRAEGALRGWNMGGTAEFFYNRGIDNSYLQNRDMINDGSDDSKAFLQALAEYKNNASAKDYTYIDPTGDTPNMPSVTKIGVKWNEGDSPETKLEKIITQKYIASYPYSYEAWVDMRRTGYPKMFPVLNPSDGDGSLKDGDLIRRMPFALTDDASLLDIQETGLKALGGADLQGTRLWWDVQGSNF
jgi:hypothetical protein